MPISKAVHLLCLALLLCAVANLSAQPPHPYAAALFVDFLLGAEARKLLEKFQYGHPTNVVPFKRWHPGFGRSVEQFEKDGNKWEKFAKEITQR